MFPKVDEKNLVKFVDGKNKFARNRAITAPSEELKLIFGPFIYAIEEFLDRVDPSYCGRKNWT